MISLQPIADVTALGPRWRALEQPAGASFFQSWSWVGCLAQERFANPMLLSARTAGREVGLAVFNRATSALSPRTLWLAESGLPALDGIYIEHNGILIDKAHAGADPDALADCLRAALARAGIGGRLVLSGCNDAHLAAARAAGGAVHLTQSQPAPYIDLRALAPNAGGFLGSLSANARHQIRRSARRYAAHGPLALHRAGDVPDALAVLADLARLHQTSWQARGKPGAFSQPFFQRFHQTLIATAFDRGEIELSRITAGPRLIGCLYNFRHNGIVLNYQSGFADLDLHPHDKPGLVCHHLAVEQARLDGAARYDFLAGDNQAKTTLANAESTLHWFDLAGRWSPRGLIGLLRH